MMAPVDPGEGHDDIGKVQELHKLHILPNLDGNKGMGGSYELFFSLVISLLFYFMNAF